MSEHENLNASSPVKSQRSLYTVAVFAFLLGLGLAVLVALFLTGGTLKPQQPVSLESTQEISHEDLSRLNDPLYGVPGQDIVTPTASSPIVDMTLASDVIASGVASTDDNSTAPPELDAEGNLIVPDAPAVQGLDLGPDLVPDEPIQPDIQAPSPSIAPPRPTEPKPREKPETQQQNSRSNDGFANDPPKAKLKPQEDDPAPVANAPKKTTETDRTARNSLGTEESSNKPEKKYMVQVGSFQNRNEAESRKAELALMGIESKIVSANVNGVTVNRVQVGPFGEGKRLRDTNQNLRDKGYDAIVIQQN